jgi:hypothetical protein
VFGAGLWSSVRVRIRCALVPKAVCLGKDLATPRDQRVTAKVASRLYQRKKRQTPEALSQETVAFPLTVAIKAKLLGQDAVVSRLLGKGTADRGGCSVCGAKSTRYCVCGADLCHDFRGDVAADFLRFVRSPNVPVLVDADPADQEDFSVRLSNIARSAGQSVEVVRHALIRGCALGAITCKPSTLVHCGGQASDAEVIESLHSAVDASEVLFRGGQCHGSLAKKDLPDAVSIFLSQYAVSIEALVSNLSAAALASDRAPLIRQLLDETRRAGSAFQAAEYWEPFYAHSVS